GRAGDPGREGPRRRPAARACPAGGEGGGRPGPGGHDLGPRQRAHHVEDEVARGPDLLRRGQLDPGRLPGRGGDPVAGRGPHLRGPPQGQPALPRPGSDRLPGRGGRAGGHRLPRLGPARDRLPDRLGREGHGRQPRVHPRGDAAAQLAVPGGGPMQKRRLSLPLPAVAVLALIATRGGEAQGTAPLGSARVSWQQAKPTTGDWGELRAHFEGETYGLRDTLTATAVVKPDPQIHPPHRHAEEEFLIVTEGSGRWHLDGKDFPAARGDAINAPPWV